MTTTPRDLTAERAACQQCLMYCEPGEYHPYVACVLYRSMGADAVRANLHAVIQHARQEALREPIQWLKDFIEWNACHEVKGKYICNQCQREAIPGQISHDDDCDIVTARTLLD